MWRGMLLYAGLKFFWNLLHLDDHIGDAKLDSKILYTVFQLNSLSVCKISMVRKLTLKAKKMKKKTIMRASIIYTLYYWFMCMHWLNYVRLNRKDRLKNMHGTTLEVAMPAGISRAHNAISSVCQCLTGSYWHEPSSLPLDVLDSDWSTKR